MTAHCISSKISFEPHSGRQITADFNGGRLTSDGGAVLLREVEKQLKLFQRLSDCFTDYRNPRQNRAPSARVAGTAHLWFDLGL